MRSPIMIAVAFSLIYILVLCLDGVLFPLLAFPIAPQLIGIIAGNVATKFVLSLPFALVILIFSIVFQGKLATFTSRKFIIKDLFAKPREILIQEIVEKNSALINSHEEIQSNQNFYNAIIENAPVSIYANSKDHRIRMVNHKWEDERKLSRTEVIGASLADLFPKELSEQFIANDQKVITTKSSLVFEEQTEDPDGTHHYQTIKFPIFNNAGEVEAVGGISSDITLLKMKEQGILRHSRLYAILSQINQTIVRIKSQQELFDQICQISVEYGNYNFAWAGLIQPDESILPVSHFNDQGYINDLNVTIKNESSGQGPAGVAARENRIVVINNIQNDIRMQPWWDAANRFGYQSVAALPLQCQQKLIGVLMLYSGTNDFIDDDEIQLLTEINNDINFALDTIKMQENQRHNEKSLIESEEKYRTLVETSHDLIWSTDQDWRITFINRASKEIFGYEPEEMIGHLYQEFTTQEQFDRNEEVNRSVLAVTDKNFGFVSMMLRKDGEKVFISANSIVQRDQQGNILGSSGVSRDITKLIQADIDRDLYTNQLNAMGKLGIKINSANTIADITKETVRNSPAIFNCNMSMLSFTKSDNCSQEIQSYYISDLYEQFFDWYKFVRNSKGGGIYRQICETNQPMRISKEELVHHPDWTNLGRAYGKNTPLSGWLIVPLISRDGMNMGLIQLSDKIEKDFTDNDLSILVQISQFVSPSIEKLRILEQLGIAKEKTRKLAQQILFAHENERSTISRELHDDSGQTLTALKINLQMLAQDIAETNQLLVPQINDCVQLTEDTLTKIRNLALILRPPQLEAVGINTSLEGLCIEYAKRTHLQIIYQGMELSELNDQLKITLYRFLQEALTNISKHAQSNQVWVNLNRDAEYILLKVKDNGIGISDEIINNLQSSQGLGLRGMEERLELIDGKLLIDSDQGTTLTAIIPFKE